MKTLYITDLDGTLLGSGATLSPFTVNTLNELIDQGMQITVSTARSFADAAFVFDQIRFRLPVVTQNGTFLYDPKERKALYYQPIVPDAVNKTLSVLQDCHCEPCVYTYRNDHLDVEYRHPASEAHVAFIAERKGRYHKLEQADTLDLSGDIVFFSILAGREETAAAVRELEKIPEIEFAYYPDTYYVGAWFIEIAARGADKAAAVRRIKEWGDFDRVVAFGDNHNDLPMFRAADIAVAVANAKEEVKQAASLVIGSNDEDAVAQYLQQEFRKKEKANV